MNASIFQAFSDWHYFWPNPPGIRTPEFYTGHIPTVCVSQGSCGADNPIWIDGELPTGKNILY